MRIPTTDSIQELADFWDTHSVTDFDDQLEEVREPGVRRTLEQRYNRPMSPAKEQLIRLIQDQPEDSSVDDIVRELAFAAMVERGLADSDAGRTISHEEMGRRIESWRK